MEKCNLRSQKHPDLPVLPVKKEANLIARPHPTPAQFRCNQAAIHFCASWQRGSAKARGIQPSANFSNSMLPMQSSRENCLAIAIAQWPSA